MAKTASKTAFEQVLETKMNAIKDLQKQIQEMANPLFKELTNLLFQQHDNVAAIQVVGYTDYFNDGEPCTFSLRDVRVQLNDSDIWIDSDGRDADWNDKIKISKELSSSISALYSAFNDIEDEFLAVYGDHVCVEFKRDGSVTTEEYDHD